ncbi:hypothetical protein PUV54_05500 [Hyphococcus flavus]|uniref:Glycosyltransferase family 61 protein n=1 Tax=Hyphococcus flavus TaxID=1866326 RepID=A0AAF0CC56_9PROT|nr:hypothetical protein [Hyphococcus flavus]WDI32650.1 hypothetical protein PUV54_05500 [Hyphococcus flavus]
MFSYRHAKFQAPLARLRSAAASMWRAGWSAAGKYQPLTPAEKAFTFGDKVPFNGDRPLTSGNDNYQHRLSFRTPRPQFENVDDLIVTPLGASWKNGRLYEKYSSCTPGLRMLAASNNPQAEVEEGYFIQSEHVDTFGDWMSEYLSPLSTLLEIDAPVYLPQSFAAKPYVGRDAARLGIDFVPLTQPLRIRKAKVLRQQRCIRYWRVAEVEGLRRFLKVDAPTAAPGSTLYLSRHGEASEVADRTHPNLLIEEIVKGRGGRVLRTKDAELEDYLNAAQSAETLLFDHGSAAYNMVYWRPKRIIEFVSDAWWMNSFLFFADASGVRDYSILCSDQHDAEELSKRLHAMLDLPIEEAG